MGPEEGSTPVDNVVTQFSTYEDFLDSQITTVDLYYLELVLKKGRRYPPGWSWCYPGHVGP